jgi:hypothetical protein
MQPCRRVCEEAPKCTLGKQKRIEQVHGSERGQRCLDASDAALSGNGKGWRGKLLHIPLKTA